MPAYHFQENRDSFRTLVTNLEIKDGVGEILLGHEGLEKYGYDKAPWTPKEEREIRAAFAKMAGTLNLATRRGQHVEPTNTSYYAMTIKLLAVTKGVPVEKLREQLQYYAERNEAYKARRAKFPDESPDDILHTLTEEQLFQSFVEMVQSLEGPAPEKSVDKVIPEVELDKYLDEEWRFVSNVNSHRCVVQRGKD